MGSQERSYGMIPLHEIPELVKLREKKQTGALPGGRRE